MSAINPGTDPVPDATIEAAETVLAAFVTAVLADRPVELASDPVRTPELDTIVLRGDSEPAADGRYGWTLTNAAGVSVQLRIPGAPLAAVRAPGATAPMVYVDGHQWWWASAVSRTAHNLAASE